MLFYSDGVRDLDIPDTMRQVRRTVAETREAFLRRRLDDAALSTHAALVGAAIAFGEVHQAVADYLNRDRDGACAETDRLASAGILLGRCVCLSSGAIRGTEDPERIPIAALLLEAEAAVAEAAPAPLPTRLEARVPEGYAYYCLYPEMYLASTERMLAEDERGRPGIAGRSRLLREAEHRRQATPYIVIGIRSIGTSLAAIVAGALQESGFPVRMETVRPRGHPFDRYINLAPSLQMRLAADRSSGARFVVVDEGPGLTCSSFLSVSAALAALGVGEERLAILSAWRGAPSVLASEDSRSRWQRLRVFHTDAADAFQGWTAFLPFVGEALGKGAAGTGFEALDGAAIRDLSYGRWRELLYGSADLWPAVHRASERVKVLYQFGRPFPPAPFPKGKGEREESFGDTPNPARRCALDPPPEDRQVSLHILAKFVGLGRYGEEKYERACVLAEAGFGPPVLGRGYGFILYRFIQGGRPLRAADLSMALLARMVAYYAVVLRRFASPPAPRFHSLAEMISVNAKEALALDSAAFLALWEDCRGAIDALPLARLDGRPAPHEWVEVDRQDGVRYMKTDGEDHFQDHTLVGQQSILWDLAGACEEWEMDGTQVSAFLDLWQRDTGDGQARDLLGFYRAAYLSFRLAAMHYAVHATDEDDIRRSLQHEEWKYGERLRKVLSAKPRRGGLC